MECLFDLSHERVRPPQTAAEKEAQREAKAEAEILLHEKLQALMDVGNDESVEKSVRHFIDMYYEQATEAGRIIPNWRRS